MTLISKSLIFLLALILPQAFSQTTCSASGSTFYDGFLDTYLYYGSFSRSSNSYFKIDNPYISQSPITSTTISFWAKIPTLSTSGTLQTGRFLDCQDIVQLKLMNDTIRFDVAVNQNVFTSGKNGQLNIQQFSSSLLPLQQWNNYAFTFVSGAQSIYLNGLQIATQTLSITSLSTSSLYCVIGNSIANDDPLTGFLRHFYVSNSSWPSTTSISNSIHHVKLPSTLNTLAYYQFSKNFFFGEQYYYNASSTFQPLGVSIQYSSEPEFVCYCTGTYPDFVNISSSFTLNNINLTAQNTGNKLDSNGLYFMFQIYAQKQTGTSDQILFTIVNYANFVLTNNLNTLRVDLLSSSSATTSSISFPSYNFRYNSWNQHTILITKTSAKIWLNGEMFDIVTSTNTFNTAADTLKIIAPTSISYLVNNITIKTYRNLLVGNFTFQQNVVDSQVTASSGTIVFGQSNSLCYAPLANLTTYWTGQNCMDNRLFPYFNQKKVTSNLMKSTMTSSNSNMTIDLWIKDINTVSSTTVVIFENTLDSANPLLQIALTTGASTTASRSISCSPMMLTQSTVAATISNILTFNLWGHFSCTSFQSSNSVTAIYYSQSLATEVAATVNNIAFYPLTSSITTALGSSVTGLKQYQGFIRQFRIWNTPLTTYQMQMYRFQVIGASTSGIGASILYSFLMSDQFNPFQVQDSISPTTSFIEQGTSLAQPTISWFSETSLTLCQPGLYYNGNCCQEFNLTGATFTFQYSASKNQYVVALSSTGMTSNMFVYNTLQANFSVYSLKNNFFYNTSTTYLDILQGYFNVNQTKGFSINSNFINPLAYSITLQAVIYSDYQPTQSITITQTLTLTCPMLWLSILPNYATDNTQVVSSVSTELIPQISTTVINQCYNITTNSVQIVTMSNIAWSSNVTYPKFSTLFTTSSDTSYVQAVSSKPTFNSTNQYMKVSAVVYYNNNKNSITNSINLNFLALKITTKYTNNYMSVNLTQGQSLSLDLSSAAISPSSPNNVILYSVNCPSYAFNSTDLYNSLCQISSAGIFTITNTSQLYVVANYPYIFSVSMNINGTSIVSSFIATVQFLKDGGSSNCPRLLMQTQYVFYINQTSNLQLMPDPYLSCAGTINQVSSVDWTVTDAATGQSYKSLLNFGSQSVYLFANITPAAKISNNIMAGQTLTVQVKFNLQDGQSMTTQTSVVFSQNLLQPVVYIYGKNKTVIGNPVSFIEQNMILNASSSYDPDNLTAQVFSFTWSCPSLVTQYYSCSSLIRGNSNEYLYLNALQRSKIGFAYNTPYVFNVTITSISNSYKTPVLLQFNVTFASPQKTDQALNYDMITKCVSVNSQGGALYNSGLTLTPKILKYDVTNYTNSYFNVFANNYVNSTCPTINYDDQSMFIYIFDLGFFPLTTPSALIFEQLASKSISASLTVPMNLSSQFNLVSPKITTTTYLQATIYYFSTVSGNLDTVYLSLDTFFIYKNKSPLVASFVNSVLSVDKYATLTLDASSSYDPDNLYSNYTFKWICPNNTYCATQSSSTLVLTSPTRSYSNFNTNGTTYTFSVSMTDGSRTSALATAQVTVTAWNNYTLCANIQMLTDELNSYSQNTIFIEYNQVMNIPINMNVTTVCNAINLDTPTFKIISPQTSTSLMPWVIQTSTPTQATLINTKFVSQLTPGTNYTVQFTQSYSLGVDYSIKYSGVFQFFIIQTMPQFQFVYKGPKVSYFSSQQTYIVLDASSTIDPAYQDFDVNWDCPSYFGGNNCSDSLMNNLTYDHFLAYTQNSSNSIDYYYNMSHPFTLTLSTVNQTRVQSQTYYLFLASQGSQLASSGASQCGIYASNGDSTQIPISKTVTFQFNCPGSSALTLALLTNQTLTWNIAELVLNVDYFQSSTTLYLNAYAANKLANSQITVSVAFNTFVNPFQRQFTIILNQYQNGSMVSQPSINATYRPYNFSFSSFSSLYQYGMHFSMRRRNGYSDEMLLPTKPFNSKYQQILYTNLLIPSGNQLYQDFYDMNFNYMGTYNISSNLLSTISSLSLSQTDFETVFNPIIAKTISNYDNTNSSKAQFEQDLYQTLMFSETLLNNLISYDTNGTTQELYVLSIIQYLVNNFLKVTTVYYDITKSPYDYISIVSLDKKVVSILYNLLNLNITITQFNTVSGILSIMDQINSQYSTLTAYGNDQQIIRQQIISIMEELLLQVNTNFQSDTTENASNKQNLISRINTFNQKFISSDLSGLVVGQINSYIVGSSNIQMLLLNSTDTIKVLTSTINSNEFVTILDQSQLSSYQINSMEVSFSFESNDSSPTSTLLDINAYNSNYQLLDINFDQVQTTSLYSFINYFLKDSESTRQLDASTSNINFQLSIKPSYLYLFKQNFTTNNNKTTTKYTPKCAYLDKTTNTWSEQGITTIDYNNQTGLILCSTSHLSTFSVDYSIASSDIITVQGQYYFVDQVGIYAGVVGGISFIVIALIVFTLKSFTNWDYNDPHLSKDEEYFSFCSILGSSYLLYHPFISAFCGPKRANINTTMTKFNKMVNFWLTFFVMAFVVVLLFYLLPNYDTDPKWKIFMILGAIIAGGIIVLRILLISLSFLIYFKDAKVADYESPKKSKKNYSINSSSESRKKKKKSEEESLISGSSMSKKKKGKKSSSSGGSKKSRSKQLREKYNFELEGGSSDDEQYTYRQKQQKGSRNRQQSSEQQITAPIRNTSNNRQAQDSQKQSSNRQDVKSSKYDKYYEDTTKQTSNIYSGNQPSSLSNQRDNSNPRKDKNKTDMGYGINSTVNDSSAGERGQIKPKKRDDSQENSKAKRIVNESNFRGTNNPKKYQDSSDSDGRKLKKQEKDLNAYALNVGMSKQSSESSYSKPKQQSSQSNQLGQSSQVSSKQHTSQFKERGITREPSKEKNRYKSEEEKVEKYYHKSKNPVETANSNFGSAVYRPGKQNEQISQKMDSKSSMNKDKKKVNEQVYGNTKINSTISNYTESAEKTIKSDKKSKYNKDNSSNDESGDRRKKKSNKQELEDTKSPHYNGVMIAISLAKMLILFAFMGVTFWLMRFLVDLNAVISWLEIFGGAFLSLVFVIDTIFIFIFAVIFRFAGPGICSQITGTILLGNGHRNLVDGLVYDLNNK